MRKLLQILAFIIVAVGVILLIFSVFNEDQEKEEEPEDLANDEWGIGPNPFEKGTPQYANWERIRRKKEAEEHLEEFEELVNKIKDGDKEKEPVTEQDSSDDNGDTIPD